MSLPRMARLALLAVLLAVSLGDARGQPVSAESPVVHSVLFWSPTCPACHVVKEQVLPPIQAQYGEQLVIHGVEISTQEAQDFWFEFMAEAGLGRDSAYIPMLFVGDEVMIGSGEVAEEFPALVEAYLASGGVAAPAALQGNERLVQPLGKAADAAPTPTAAPAPPSAESEAVVYALLFTTPTCPACIVAKTEVLPPIKEQYGDSLVILEFDVTGADAQALWFDAMEDAGLGRDQAFVPMLFVGEQVLTGAGEIADALPTLVDAYLAEGGVAPAAAYTQRHGSPSPEPGEAPLIYAALFTEPNCEACEAAERMVEQLESRHPALLVERYDLRQAALLNEFLGQQTGLPKDQRLVAPALFVGERAFVGASLRSADAEAAVASYAASGSPRYWEGYEDALPALERALRERSRPAAIAGAGLAARRSPLPYVAAALLAAYLWLARATRRHLLWTGVVYVAVLFVAYLTTGLGILGGAQGAGALGGVSRWTYVVATMGCLALAWQRFSHYGEARRRVQEAERRQRPAASRRKSKPPAARISVGGASLLALLVGLVVALSELAQGAAVPPPVVTASLGMTGQAPRALALILLYSLIYTLPLLALLLLLYLAGSSQKLVSWARRGAALLTLGVGALFVGLGAWLVYSLVAMAV